MPSRNQDSHFNEKMGVIRWLAHRTGLDSHTYLQRKLLLKKYIHKKWTFCSIALYGSTDENLVQKKPLKESSLKGILHPQTDTSHRLPSEPESVHLAFFTHTCYSCRMSMAHHIVISTIQNIKCLKYAAF